MKCAYLLTDANAALDLLQETLHRACNTRKRVAQVQDPERYVRIMLNEIRSQQRRSRLPATSLDQLSAPDLPMQDATSQVDDAVLIAGARMSLSRRQRAVVVFRYWADLDDQQIADVLGCRRATVRSIAARCMHKLKRVSES